ncbi:MAG: hypothetical protein MUP28_00160 [Candidatus Aminicenantes bacterium]|nr:hypothetical protein [Candidatus Aminicenantes bacterium]
MANETKEKITGGEALDERSVTSEMSLISIPERGISIEKELAAIEKNVEFYNKVKIIALKMTKASDWVDLGGNPYLMDRGTENVAVAFGVDVSDVRLSMEWAEDAKGRYYSFIAAGKAYSKKLGRYVEDIGVCSQRDKFFGKIGDKFKEIEEVDMANIRRKAVTNLYNRLIKRVIGLMGVTFDDLVQAGIKKEQLGKVEYKGGAQKASDLTPDGKDIKAKLESMIARMSNNDKVVAAELIKKFSMWKEKDGEKKEHFVTDISKLSEKWLASTYGKAKAEYEKTSGGPREPGQDG